MGDGRVGGAAGRGERTGKGRGARARALGVAGGARARRAHRDVVATSRQRGREEDGWRLTGGVGNGATVFGEDVEAEGGDGRRRRGGGADDGGWRGDSGGVVRRWRRASGASIAPDRIHAGGRLRRRATAGPRGRRQ